MRKNFAYDRHLDLPDEPRMSCPLCSDIHKRIIDSDDCDEPEAHEEQWELYAYPDEP